MKRNRINAFTLVEMLIVIVIIGILIAALMPRMQSAQGRARDVARKNDLSQIQTAIVTSQQDKGKWPWTGTNSVINVSDIESLLTTAGMSSVPKDPITSSTFVSVNGTTITSGNYAYAIMKRNGTNSGGFLLMAKTEIEGGSNWVVCGSGTNYETNATTKAPKKGGIQTSSMDLKNIHPCTKLTKSSTGFCSTEDYSDCFYEKEGELRYIVIY